MIDFDPKCAVDMLKEAKNTGLDETIGCWYPIIIDKSKFPSDRKMRKLAYYAKIMQNDGVIELFQDLHNGPVYYLDSVAFDVIDSGIYPTEKSEKISVQTSMANNGGVVANNIMGDVITQNISSDSGKQIEKTTKSVHYFRGIVYIFIALLILFAGMLLQAYYGFLRFFED